LLFVQFAKLGLINRKIERLIEDSSLKSKLFKLQFRHPKNACFEFYLRLISLFCCVEASVTGDPTNLCQDNLFIMLSSAPWSRRTSSPNELVHARYFGSKNYVYRVWIAFIYRKGSFFLRTRFLF